MSTPSPLQALEPDWPRVEALLDEALALDPPLRADWLAARSDLAPALRQQVARLLGNAEQVDAQRRFETLPALPAGDLPADPAATAEPAAGDTVGPWLLLNKLGSGGMGSVWLAERVDSLLQRTVALKLPRMRLAHGLPERMARERNILGSLQHPHIARLYDAGVDAEGLPWLALEYVQGQPIDLHVRDAGLTLRARVELLLQVCGAVSYAHSQLVIHRDLKPSNILVAKDGQARLLDFGIAKLLQPGLGPSTAPGIDSDGGFTDFAGLALTPGYASPEQLQAAVLGTASDQYSLAVVAYELLAGRRPHDLTPRTASGYERAVLAGPPPLASARCNDTACRKGLRGDLDAVLDRALNIEPNARYASVDAFASDLRAWLAGDNVSTRRLGRAVQFKRWAARHQTVLLAGGVVSVALLAGTVVSGWQALRAREQTLVAQAEAREARRQATKAAAMQALSTRILKLNSLNQPDPQAAQRTTVRELLDLTAKAVPEVLKDAPDSQVEVLGILSRLYAQAGAPGPSTQLARDRAALARRALPDGDVNRAEALLGLAARLHDTPERPQARALLDEAAAVLARSGLGGTPQHAQLELQWARHLRYSQLVQAVAHSQRALQLTPWAADDLGARARVLYFGAVMHELAGQTDRAAEMLIEARDRGRQAGAAGHDAQLAGVSELGELLEKRGLWAQAGTVHDEALALTRSLLGESHRSTIVVALNRARFLAETGSTAEADREWVRIDTLMRGARPPLESWWQDYARLLWHRIDASRGRPDLAEPLLRKSVESLRVSVPTSGVFARRQLQLASALQELGRFDEARQLLETAEATWNRYAEGSPPALAHGFWLLRAKLALAQGQAEAARAQLNRIGPTPGLAAGVPDPMLIQRDTELARVELALGRPAQARAHAEAALAALNLLPPGVALPSLEANARMALGAAWRAAGQVAAARVEMDRVLALRRTHDLPSSQWVVAAQAARRALDGAPLPARLARD